MASEVLAGVFAMIYGYVYSGVPSSLAMANY